MKSRLTVLLAAGAALAAVAVVPTFASGAPSGTPPPPGAIVDVVHIKGGFSHHGTNLRFVPPPTVHTGDYLEIDNNTNPHKVGPHTFSLVQAPFIPKTKHATRACFTNKNHICRAIAKWHGAKGNKPPTVNPVEAGLPGWDTMGSLTTTGDSWFTGSKPNATFVQQVSAAPGTTLTFMCAIHGFMHGKITVQAPGT
jgi:hypothetical protein